MLEDQKCECGKGLCELHRVMYALLAEHALHHSEEVCVGCVGLGNGHVF